MYPDLSIIFAELNAGGETDSIAHLTPDVHLATGGAHLAFRTDDHLKIDVRKTQDPFDWAEIAVRLTDPAWRTCARLHLQITAAADRDVEVQPALRAVRDGQIRDIFSPAPLTLTPRRRTVGCAFDPAPEHVDEAEQVGLQLFLPTVEHGLVLSRIDITGTC